jgi:hypothetical protein
MKHSVPALLLGLGCSITFGQAAQTEAPGFGIVDCFGQPRVQVSRLMGTVFDPTGVPVPGAEVQLFPAAGFQNPRVKPLVETTTDDAGNFRLDSKPGTYMFEVKSPAFEGTQVEIDLGRDLVNTLHPARLYVMLGLAGSFCPWVTISKRGFEHEVEINQKRLDSKSTENTTLK